MKKIIIFSLENTITDLNVVPKQTYHMLQKYKELGYYIGIICYNPYSYFDAIYFNLNEYADIIKWGNSSKISLVKSTIKYIISKNNLDIYHIDKIYFIDNDKNIIDNINQMEHNIMGIYCNDFIDLYKFCKEKI